MLASGKHAHHLPSTSSRCFSTSVALQRRVRLVQSSQEDRKMEQHRARAKEEHLTEERIRGRVREMSRLIPKLEAANERVVRIHDDLVKKQAREAEAFYKKYEILAAREPRPEDYGLPADFPKPDVWEGEQLKLEPRHKLAMREDLGPAEIKERFRKMYGNGE